MAAGRIIIPNVMPALDINGNPVAGAKLTFYANETTTLQAVYTTSALTVAHPNPITADAAGAFASIFADTSVAYSVAITDADNAPIVGLRNRDNVKASLFFGDDATTRADLTLSNLSNTATARTNLGVAIGTNVQAYSANLDEYAAVNPTAAGLALLDDADASAQRTTLGLTIGTNVQAYDADLGAIAALTSAADKMPYATGAGTWAMADLTSFARSLLATASNSAFMTALGNIASTAINFLQAGTSAVTRTLSSVLQEEVRITDFGAVGDGVTDNATAIAAAITYAKTLVAPVLIIPRGEFYFTGTLTFDLPTSSTLLCYGRFTSNVSGASAIILGSASTNPNGFVVRGLSVARTTYDMNGAGATSGSVGVEILNLVVSNVEIKKVANFTYGVKVNGTQANGGVSYNIFDLFHIYDNKINLWLTASGVGYCNENIFNGGAFNHSTSYPNYTGTQNILVDHFATSILNNNRFMNPTLEDNSALSVAATINGLHNCIYWPRMENPAALTTYQIVFTANSQACSLIGQGYGVTDTNITDLGSGNCYQTKNGSSISASTGTSAGEGVVRLKSFASSAAKLILGKDTGNTETWSIDGQGIGIFNQRVYAENGFRWSTSSGTRNDRGFFPSSGSPEGAVTADPGSLSTNNSGGDGVTLYVKESGGGNTGWKAVGTYIAGSATYDAPSIAPAGTTTTTVTVTGAALGDFATCSFGLTLAGLVATAYVSAADTVTVVLFNPTLGAIDLASTTLRVRVMPV